jgi:hypothetical protein
MTTPRQVRGRGAECLRTCLAHSAKFAQYPSMLATSPRQPSHPQRILHTDESTFSDVSTLHGQGRPHPLDPRRRRSRVSWAEQCLQAERTAPHVRDEGIPLGSREPEDRALRVLAVPDVEKSSVPGGSLDAVPPAVATGASSPLTARVVTVVADTLGIRQTAHWSSPVALMSDDP